MLQITGVSKTFRQAGHDVPALVGVDLSLADGETLGLVGESGSGKSTLAKAMLGVHAPTPAGAHPRPARAGLEVGKRTADDKRAMQIIFQNPDSALNASWTVRRILHALGDEAHRRKDKAATDERSPRWPITCASRRATST